MTIFLSIVVIVLLFVIFSFFSVLKSNAEINEKLPRFNAAMKPHGFELVQEVSQNYVPKWVFRKIDDHFVCSIAIGSPLVHNHLMEVIEKNPKQMFERLLKTNKTFEIAMCRHW